ncbi:MAG: hypothetical protein ABIQ04_05265 [Candidatus Saccharimonadales bacterium]
MLSRIIAFGSGIAIVLLVVMLYMTTPAEAGPLGILFVFILMYASALGMLTFLLFGLSRVIARLSRSVTVRRPLNVLSLQRSYYFASVLALVPVMFIGMQSVGQVGLYEIVLMVLFTTIGCIYIAKRTT